MIPFCVDIQPDKYPTGCVIAWCCEGLPGPGCRTAGVRAVTCEMAGVIKPLAWELREGRFLSHVLSCTCAL